MPPQFFEGEQEFEDFPRWVKALMEFGRSWPSSEPGMRRVALISMPCDSPAAGLVTLGIMVRDFANPRANDAEGHLESLLGHARQYLGECRECTVSPCNPAEKGCGYLSKASGEFQMLGVGNDIYRISPDSDLDARVICFERKGLKVSPSAAYLNAWHVHGSPPVELREDSGSLPAEVYREIFDDADLCPSNLKTSYSGLAFAGRVAGGSKSQEVCESVAFGNGDEGRSLADLLTVDGWSDEVISRVSFYNSRTEEFDRGGPSPKVVVADGDGAFLQVVSSSRFQHSDVIGVIDRSVERERLESVGQRMASFGQWYERDEDLEQMLPGMPPGISVAILKRRG